MTLSEVSRMLDVLGGADDPIIVMIPGDTPGRKVIEADFQTTVRALAESLPSGNAAWYRIRYWAPARNQKTGEWRVVKKTGTPIELLRAKISESIKDKPRRFW